MAFQAYMSLVKNQIPGLENVEPTVIEKYVKTLVSLPGEQPTARKPAPKNLDIQHRQVTFLFLVERDVSSEGRATWQKSEGCVS